MAYRGKFDARYRNQRTSSAAPTPRPAAADGQPRRQQPAHGSQPRQPQHTAKASRGPSTGRVIFWTAYCMMIILFFGGMFFLNNWLNSWLVNFEAKQPTTKCEETFQQLFAQPNWGELYTLAEIPDTPYEGKDAFTEYMEQHVGDAELTYMETSAGLARGKKYFIMMGEENLGYFTLDNVAPGMTDMPIWEFGELHLETRYDNSILVQKTDGATIFINGTEIDDDSIIQVGTTLSENYIPDGLHGPRIYTHQVTGLMATPTVTAADSDGNPMDVSYNQETGIYTVQTSANTPTQAEIDLAVNTTKAYELRMISMDHQMSKYFDTSSASYKDILSVPTWMQKNFYQSHTFAEPVISGYYRFSDTLFTIRVDMPLLVTRTDGTTKEYPAEQSFFFQKQSAGWKCIRMTNVDVMEQVANVRLTFTLNGEVLASEFFASDAKEVTAPVVTAPQSKVFLGWFTEGVDANGEAVMNLVFSPGEGGKITVPSGYTLKPMTLVALFGNS